ncbi:hypothetical protein GA830_11190 [Mesorhizobium sp. NBSH29]|nr:hypothetical protein [Mesorhizobium sp. NBSH29]QPC88663.1 hypothetical protein GA830_11190 [Mesorhizobium sp. NBSH29]
MAGAYSFSDELGGFVITDARGVGSRRDPVVITQELQTASPVTLTIRAVTPALPSRDFDPADGILYLRLEVLNNSGQAWIEVEFELQERYKIASEFGDGLSFDQRTTESHAVSSDSFARYDRNFEPYDRLLFKEGKVDPLNTASFSFLITDFTPRPTFYLVLDPRIPSS